MTKSILLFFMVVFCFGSAQAQFRDDCGTHVQTYVPVDLAKAQLNRSIFSMPYQLRLFLHICADDDGSRLAVSNSAAFATYLEGTRQFYAAHNICFSLVGIDTIQSTELNDMVIDLSSDYTALVAKLVPNTVNVFFHTTLSDGNGGGYNGNAYAIPNYFCSIRGGLVGTTNTSTMAHEMGHDYGLYHTFETINNKHETVPRSGAHSNCTIAGDILCDTDADPGLDGNTVNSSCVYIGGQKDSLGNNYTPPVNNLMTYGNFPCRNLFTPNQEDRMLNFIVTNSNLVNALNDDNQTVTNSLALNSGIYFKTARNTVAIAPSISTISSYSIAGSAKAYFTAQDYIDFKPGAQFAPSAAAGLTDAHINTLCQ